MDDKEIPQAEIGQIEGTRSGPKHARPRPPGVLGRLRGAEPKSAVTEFVRESPSVTKPESLYDRNGIAQPGDYERILDNTSFKDSRLMRKAGKFIESGEFQLGVEDTLTRIANRGIQIESVPREQIETITRLDKVGNDTRSVMVLPDNFEQLQPEIQLWELLRRNMELILQRLGAQSVPEMRNEIYKMGLVYARTLRKTTEDQVKGRAMVNVSAKIIEDWAHEQLESQKR